jgi:hypothetical protein
MRRAILSLSAAAALTFAVSTVQAMPLSDVDGSSSPHVTLVYGGCGPYAHRGPYGGCRPGGQWGGYWAGGISPCPWGYHLGPYGRHCWPNN